MFVACSIFTFSQPNNIPRKELVWVQVQYMLWKESFRVAAHLRCERKAGEESFLRKTSIHEIIIGLRRRRTRSNSFRWIHIGLRLGFTCVHPSPFKMSKESLFFCWCCVIFPCAYPTVDPDQTLSVRYIGLRLRYSFRGRYWAERLRLRVDEFSFLEEKKCYKQRKNWWKKKKF